MPHALRTTVEDFVHGLKSLERDAITKDILGKYLDSMRLGAEALRPFTFFRDEFYTRNLIYKDSIFEFMILCWKPGQRTPIHTHNGQLGWMTMAQGEVAIHNYRYVSCNAPENQNVVGLDCLGGASRIELEPLETLPCGVGGPVSTVDKLQTIHQIRNVDNAQAGSISLHLYSLPFDSCITFDLEHQRCFRKSLRYFSRDGKIETEIPPETNLIVPTQIKINR